jgi:hypothetical protein
VIEDEAQAAGLGIRVQDDRPTSRHCFGKLCRRFNTAGAFAMRAEPPAAVIASLPL